MSTPLTDYLAAVARAQEELYRQTGKSIESITITLDTEMFRRLDSERVRYYEPYPKVGGDRLIFVCSSGPYIEVKRKPHECNCEYCTKK